MPAIPDFLLQALQNQYGEALAEQICQGYACRRPVTLRVNTLKTTPEAVREGLAEAGIAWEEVGWSREALILPQSRESDLEGLPMYQQGEIYLQSLSSMLPPLFLRPQPGENVLDMAAAPGGKTTQMAALSGGKAMITACEKNAIRAERLKFNIQRQGAGRVSVLVQDARKLDDFFSFDKILLDAPCSGSGTLAVRQGELAGKFSRELVDNSARLQEALLRKALRLLKPGHEMIYSTCSILQKENEDVLRRTAAAAGGEVVPLELDAFAEIPRLPSDTPGTLLVAPGPLYEGFFVARIVKTRQSRKGGR